MTSVKSIADTPISKSGADAPAALPDGSGPPMNLPLTLPVAGWKSASIIRFCRWLRRKTSVSEEVSEEVCQRVAV